jgi:hypothetical protein
MKLINPGSSRRGWHRLQNALKCPRLAAWSARDREAQSEACPSAPLIKGSLLHMGLAHYYAQKREREDGKSESEYYDPVGAMTKLVESQPAAHQGQWSEWVPMVTGTLLNYMIHWQSERWTPWEVEKELETTIRDEGRRKDFLYTQRVDAIFLHPQNGKTWFVDHKSTFKIMDKTTKKYSLSGQFLGYNLLGMRMYGPRFGGVLLNLIGWGSKKSGPEFQRITLPAAPFSQERFEKTLVYAERILEDHEGQEPGDWPGAHHETACWTTYGPCKYFDRCHYGE